MYRKLAERKPEEWQETFLSSTFFLRYVRERMTVEAEAGGAVGEEREADERPAVNPFRQTWILVRRYASIWQGDRQALLAMLGQSLLVALLLGIVFGRLDNVENPLERVQRTINLLFLLNVSCFWFGCNNAAKELVKERVIYQRERDFNLRIDSYFASKSAILVLIAWIQAAVLLGIIRMWCGPAGSAMGQGVVLAVLAAAGTMLGLLISALAQTEEVAAALVPIAIIPQIILAGVIAPLRGLGKLLANGLITARWAAQALESLLPADMLALLHGDRAAYHQSVAMAVVHLVVFAAATLAILWRQGQVKRTV